MITNKKCVALCARSFRRGWEARNKELQKLLNKDKKFCVDFFGFHKDWSNEFNSGANEFRLWLLDELKTPEEKAKAFIKTAKKIGIKPQYESYDCEGR